MSELDKDTLMMLGEMKQSIKTMEHNCEEIFKYLHEMRTTGLPMCAEQKEKIRVVTDRVDRIEMGMVKILLAMVGSGVTGGAAVSLVRSLIGG